LVTRYQAVDRERIGSAIVDTPAHLDAPTDRRLCAVTIDCSDPVQLALFYQQFLGGTRGVHQGGVRPAR
jgi:hypothetical protein